MIDWIDVKLLSGHQKFIDKCQCLFGTNKFFFEKWSLILLNISTVIMTVVEVGLLFGFVMYCWALFTITLEIKRIGSREKAYVNEEKIYLTPHHSESLRKNLLLFIFAVLVIGSVPKIKILIIIYVCTFVAYFYFSACTPKPPSKSGISQIYEKILWKIHDSLEPKPVGT